MAGRSLRHGRRGRVVRSGRKFNDAMEALIVAEGEEAVDLCRAEMFALYRELVHKIPKDTGRAAAGFHIDSEPTERVPPPVSLKAKKQKTRDYEGKLPAITAANTVRGAALPRLSPFVISSNIEYLPALEDGHSRMQAPSGFIAECLRNAARRFEKRAAEWSAKRV